MEGKIVSYRRGRKTQNTRQLLIKISSIDNKEKAEKLVGKEVEWKSVGDKTIKGEITSPHGDKGVVRALFERGLPGQALGTKIEIKS